SYGYTPWPISGSTFEEEGPLVWEHIAGQDNHLSEEHRIPLLKSGGNSREGARSGEA
ncbi:unnamed protein product, partial [marine sediment metagenome]